MSKLAGQHFVLTGVFPTFGGSGDKNVGKKALTKFIIKAGGEVKSSVGSRTDYLVVGKKSSLINVIRAHRLRVPTIDINELKRMSEGRSIN